VLGSSAQIVTGTGTGPEHFSFSVTQRSRSFAKRVGTAPTVAILCQVVTDGESLTTNGGISLCVPSTGRTRLFPVQFDHPKAQPRPDNELSVEEQ
jgi:hypothetical protein